MYRVLGIDPGLRVTGYGLVELSDTAVEPALVEAGIIRLNGKHSFEQRLGLLYNDLDSLLDEFAPDRLAVEKLYSHYRHPRTAILMAHARGIILLCAHQHELPVDHLPSTEVKKAVCGYGHASKHQIQCAVQTQFGLKEMPSPPDVADAIAIALCQARRLVVSRL